MKSESLLFKGERSKGGKGKNGGQEGYERLEGRGEREERIKGEARAGSLWERKERRNGRRVGGKNVRQTI